MIKSKYQIGSVIRTYCAEGLILAKCEEDDKLVYKVIWIYDDGYIEGSEDHSIVVTQDIDKFDTYSEYHEITHY